MHEAILRMLERYELGTREAAIHALREILQEATLLGLWRARFFEHAAFYGGTALRLLHGLDRFSEDLDFTLLQPHPDFDLSSYLSALVEELSALGFTVSVEEKNKSGASAIWSAFLKAGTRLHLLEISATAALAEAIPHNQSFKLRIEIDTNPPAGIETETRFLFQPIAFSVRSCTLPDLFAGKLHAVLCRAWKSRVKGRDWYDFAWFAANHPSVNLPHLEARLRQSGHWSVETPLDLPSLLGMLDARIARVDIEAVKREVRPFLRDARGPDVWSQDFFRAAARRVRG